MYYGVDENGNLVSSEDSSVLPENFQDVFPDDVPPQMDDPGDMDPGASLVPPAFTGSGNSVNIYLPDGSDVSEDGSGSVSIVTPDIDYVALADALSNSIDYDAIVDALSASPMYTVYPSTSAVAVFEKVLNNIDGKFGYVVQSGSSTNETMLYFADDYSVSGSNITLKSPVTYCRYYSYRPTSSSNTVYTYSVSTVGDMSFTLSNQLVYTNLKDGYPDLIEYKRRDYYLMAWVIAFCLIMVFLSTMSARFRSRKRGDK